MLLARLVSNPQPQTPGELGAGPVPIPDVPIQGYLAVRAVRQIPALIERVMLAGTLPIQHSPRNTDAAVEAAAVAEAKPELQVLQPPMAGVRRGQARPQPVLWKLHTSFDFPLWEF